MWSWLIANNFRMADGMGLKLSGNVQNRISIKVVEFYFNCIYRTEVIKKKSVGGAQCAPPPPPGKIGLRSSTLRTWRIASVLWKLLAS